MGKYLPIEAEPVQAFQWKSNSTVLVYELIKFLVDEDHHFELLATSSGVSIIIGFDMDDQIQVDENQWVIFKGPDILTRSTKDFFENFKAAGS